MQGLSFKAYLLELVAGWSAAWRGLGLRLWQSAWAGARRARAVLACQRGQGTTEYAILVGVLVVIAIIAVVAFRGKLEQLWTSISNGVNSL